MKTDFCLKAILIKLLFIHILFISFVYSIELFSNDPDIDRNTTELIKSRGFQSETHTVITKDLYILTLFRIRNPFFRNRTKLYPVYLQYGVLGNTEQWLISSAGSLHTNGVYVETDTSPPIINNCRPNGSVANSLPFVLSACGYDVWLGNVRGSSYSSHVILGRTDSRFWSYNLDHYSRYDIIANIDYILNETKSESLSYIGYSLGNAFMFQLLSSEPQYSRIVKPFISLASFVYLGGVQSPLVRLSQVFEWILRLVSVRIGGLGEYQHLFGRYFCGNSLLKEICFLIYSLIGGFDAENLDKDFLPRLWAHFPDSMSTTAVSHVGQRMRTNQFNYYDYGSERNQQLYRQSEPIDYNISRIDSNYLVLMSGRNDFLSDVSDDNMLRTKLKVQPYLDYIIPNPNWTHGDFLYATTTGKYINSVILRIFESMNLNSSLT